MALSILKISKKGYNKFVDDQIRNSLIDDFGKKHGMDHYKTYTFKEKKVLLGAKSGGKIIGALSLTINRGSARIGSFAVSKKMRGKGIGVALLGEARKMARMNGCEKLWLWTLPNMPAYKFYKKQGFIEEARLKRQWGGKDLCVMSRFI